MLVIRLARGGRTKYPTYRIVAAESSRAATGKFVEVLGHYNPHTKELVLKKEQIQSRLSHGAQPSNSVARLLQKEGMELPAWVKIETKSRPPKKEPEVKEPATPAAEASDSAEATEAPEATEPAAAEPAADEPAEDAPAEPAGDTPTEPDEAAADAK